MKYNSIGEQLIAKAKELDPSYKPDKFNDMSEALDVILNNTGGGGEGLNILSLNLKNCMNESDYNELVGYILQKAVIAKTYNITLPDLTDVDVVKFAIETPIGNTNAIFYRNSKALTQFNWLCNWTDDENFMQMVTITGNTDNNVKYIKYNGIDGGKSVPPTLNLINFETSEVRTTITEEEKTNLDNGLYNQIVYMQNESDYLGYQLPTKLIADSANQVYSFATFSSDSISLKLTGISLVSINIGEKDETTNTYPITFEDNAQISLPGADTRTVVLFNKPNQILAPNDGGADIILPLPADASTSTYVLKAVNGTVQWVKES